MSEDKKMTACVLRNIGDLRVEQVNIPQLSPGQVLVKVRAAGICGSDVERVFTKGVYHYPTIIGHEFAGEVVDVGSEDRDWLGKRVSVFPLIPCFRCPSCMEGRYAQCQHYDYYGSRRDGGFAEYQAINTWNLLPVPDTVAFESAAMFEPAAVAMHALGQAGPLQGRTIAIFGVGAIALIMAQIAANAGCSRVVLVARSQEKADFAKRMGFGDVINSRVENVQARVSELTNGQGVDIAVEGCGSSATLEDALAVSAAFGTVICMGNPKDDISLRRDAYWGILRKQLRLCGTWNSSFKVSHNDWKAVLDMVETGRLRLRDLITGRYSFEQAETAFNDIHMNAGQGVHIKSMFINGEERV